MAEVTLQVVLAWIRIVLILLGFEATLRYSAWWWSTRYIGNGVGSVLRIQLLGTIVITAAIMFGAFFGICHGPPHGNHSLVFLVLIDSLLSVGTIIKLVPAWRLCYGCESRGCAVHALTRLALATMVLVMLRSVSTV